MSLHNNNKNNLVSSYLLDENLLSENLHSKILSNVNPLIESFNLRNSNLNFNFLSSELSEINFNEATFPSTQLFDNFLLDKDFKLLSLNKNGRRPI